MKLTVVFDLETTGFCPMPTFSKYHKIVQICAKAVESGELFNSFVDPGGLVPIPSSEIHQISDDDVRGQMQINVVFGKLERFFEFEKYREVEMVAHNCWFFDELVLRKEVEIPPNVRFWDTLPFFRRVFPGLPSGYSLGALHRHFYGEEIENAHRADADVQALARLYVDHVEPRRAGYCDTLFEERITSLYYIGPYRGILICEKLNIDTVSQLKNYWKAESHLDKLALDRFMIDTLGVTNVTERMFLIWQILDVPPYGGAIQDYLILTCPEDCLDAVDYYHKYRYVLRRKAPNQCCYQRGLMAVKNKTR